MAEMMSMIICYHSQGQPGTSLGFKKGANKLISDGSDTTSDPPAHLSEAKNVSSNEGPAYSYTYRAVEDKHLS